MSVPEYYYNKIICTFLLVNTNSNQARKALVVVVIEGVLLKMGKSVYDEVIHSLYKDYHCYLSDCYDKPEYLKSVLQDLYGKSHVSIIESIKKHLGEYTIQEGIDAFVIGLSV